MTIEEFKEQEKHLLNTYVLDYTKVCLYVDIEQDENDFYRVLETNRGDEPVVWLSVVCPIFPLKGKLDESDYNELDRVWKLNRDIKKQLNGSIA